jgi:hypothetical protein
MTNASSGYGVQPIACNPRERFFNAPRMRVYACRPAGRSRPARQVHVRATSVFDPRTEALLTMPRAVQSRVNAFGLSWTIRADTTTVNTRRSPERARNPQAHPVPSAGTHPDGSGEQHDPAGGSFPSPNGAAFSTSPLRSRLGLIRANLRRLRGGSALPRRRRRLRRHQRDGMNPLWRRSCRV